MIEVITVCYLTQEPAKCERVVDGKIYRCNKYIQVAGQDPLTKERIDGWDCVEVWKLKASLEVAVTNRGTAEAVISMREETVKRQDAVISLAAIVTTSRAKEAKLLTQEDIDSGVLGLGDR